MSDHACYESVLASQSLGLDDNEVINYLTTPGPNPEEVWRRVVVICMSTIAEELTRPPAPESAFAAPEYVEGDGPLRPMTYKEIEEREVKAKHGAALGEFLLASRALWEISYRFNRRVEVAEKNIYSERDWFGLADLVVRGRRELRRVARVFLHLSTKSNAPASDDAVGHDEWSQTKTEIDAAAR